MGELAHSEGIELREEDKMSQKSITKAILKDLANGKFDVRKGAPFPQEMAQPYGERLTTLMKEYDDELKPEWIVKDAKNKDAIYHEYFEWNNTVAGEQWRIQQARELVNHLVFIDVKDSRETPYRAFVSVTNAEGEKVYVALKTALDNPSYLKELIGKLKTTLQNGIVFLNLLEAHI